VPYDECDIDEENGGEDPGSEYDGESEATGMFDLGDVSAALSVRNSRKLCHTTSMMSMRRMTVTTLAASTMASQKRRVCSIFVTLAQLSASETAGSCAIRRV
jgi:hypothetical protein